jgi:deoxyribodipyrimidine photo-lyase
MAEFFAPTDEALEALISAIDIRAYEKTRNHLTGKVTRLSPYITHGFISIPTLFERLPRLTLEDKLAFEFGWREFFHHVWHRAGDGILEDMRAGLPGIRYQHELPEDVREGRTGLPVIDKAVHTLYDTGYLHNHARMWVASYLVHLRKVHWRTGADWMYAHLLDGDLASNHLSWQWVAATFSSKPYLFNAENVARYAPAGWHCERSTVDTSYEALDTIARRSQTIDVSPALLGMSEPERHAAPPLEASALRLTPKARVRLVHPWMMESTPFDGVRIGVIHLPFHRRFPWSAARWNFVMRRLQQVTDELFIGDLTELGVLLSGSSCIESAATLNPDYRETLSGLCTQLSAPARRFPDPEKACRSFSAFWSVCTQGSEDAPRRAWHR